MAKKINTFEGIFNSILVAFALVSSTTGFGAQQGDSAQQALEQLRMLQQRLSNTPGATADAGSSPGGTGSPNVATTTTTPAPAIAGQSGNTPSGTTTTTVASPALGSNTGTARTTTTTTTTTTGDGQGQPPVDKETIDELAFQQVEDQMFPLKPEEIIRLKQMYHSTEYAQAATAGTPPKPTATSQLVNLSPGSTPPVIRLSQGFVSSLVFLDSTGAPWPISAYDLGDPTAFNIQWDKTSNTLMIQAIKLYNYGNLAVRLKGLNTPVMLTLIPGQKAVDYRVDLRIQGLGPNAKSMPLEVGVPPSANDLLLSILDGVPPPGSSRLTVSGGDARAWLINDKMYVRTDLTILSPGWIGSMTSADGMHAYEMQKSPVLLVSWHGKVMQLKVEGL